MDITLEFTRRLLERERSRRESDRLSDQQIRQLGDALLPTCRQLLLELPDEGLDSLVCSVVWRIETTHAVDLMIEVLQRGRSEARQLSLFCLSMFFVSRRNPDNDRPTSPTDGRRASLVDHMRAHPALKSAVFEFRHSSTDAECELFSEMCLQFRWRDGLPFMRTMIELVDEEHAKQIREYCRTLERDV